MCWLTRVAFSGNRARRGVRGAAGELLGAEAGTPARNAEIERMSLVSQIVALAGAAGEEIMTIYALEDHGTTAKADDSPLTLADRAAHDRIASGLKEIDSTIAVLSEEEEAAAHDERAGWKRFWLVDPLDGTKEFIKRNGEFTVNIALIENGRPTMGVVHAPVLKTTYWGVEGSGAWKSVDGGEPQPIHVSDYRKTGLKVVGSRSHAGAWMPPFLEALGNPPLVSIGSSLKFCLVADGSANLYPRFGPTMEWDIAAAYAVVAGAGGAITDIDGGELEFNKPDLHNPYFVVAGAPPYPWRPALETIKEAV
jgi:3'(2'), 5'-bisphosphate nucleotidase